VKRLPAVGTAFWVREEIPRQSIVYRLAKATTARDDGGGRGGRLGTLEDTPDIEQFDRLG
jgi:hypothetical protein